MTTNKGTALPVSQDSNTIRAMRKQLVTSVRQGQRLSAVATKVLINNVVLVARPDLSKVPDLPGFSSVAAVATYPLDVAAELLDAQRAVIGQLSGRSFRPSRGESAPR